MNLKKKLIIISIAGMLVSSVLLLVIINLKTGSWVYELTTNTEETYSSCAISGDGRYTVVGSGNDHLYFFDTSNYNPIWMLRMDERVLVDISYDGQYIVASADNDLYLLSNLNAVPIWTFSTDSRINFVRISGDGNYIIMQDEFSNRLFLFHRTSNIPIWNKISAGSWFDISFDGNKIVSINNGILNVFNKSSTIPEWQYDTGEIVSKVIISPNGQIIASGGQDSRVRIFNITGTSPIQTYTTGGLVRDLSSSQDGTFIAAGCSDGFYLYNTSNSSHLWTFPTDDDGYCIDISTDGNFIVGSGVKYDVGYDYIYYFRRTENVPIWTKQVVHYSRKVCISADGRNIAAATGFNFYLINANNPAIDEFYSIKFSSGVVSLSIFIGIGILMGSIHFIRWRLKILREKERIEKEKVEKEIIGAIDHLGDKYEEWDDQD